MTLVDGGGAGWGRVGGVGWDVDGAGWDGELRLVGRPAGVSSSLAESHASSFSQLSWDCESDRDSAASEEAGGRLRLIGPAQQVRSASSEMELQYHHHHPKPASSHNNPPETRQQRPF